MYTFLAVLIYILAVFPCAFGHGMMTNPAGRSSVWRYYRSYPANYNDNQNFCGGRHLLVSSGGKCGICGDPYNQAHPQDNENTGKYGKGKITGRYSAGKVIDVTITLTANHMGEFTYSLCQLTDPNTYESDEGCFIPLHLEDGSDKYIVKNGDSTVISRVKLPDGITCSRCVLRWNYKVGNSWGVCDDGTQGSGCGFQETFRSCADISIL